MTSQQKPSKRVTFNQLTTIREFNKDMPPSIVKQTDNTSRAIKYPKSIYKRYRPTSGYYFGQPTQVFAPQVFYSQQYYQYLLQHQLQPFSFQHSAGNYVNYPAVNNRPSVAPLNPFYNPFINYYNLAQRYAVAAPQTNPFLNDTTDSESESEQEAENSKPAKSESSKENLLDSEESEQSSLESDSSAESTDKQNSPDPQESLVISPLSPSILSQDKTLLNPASSYISLSSSSSESSLSSGMSADASVPRSFYTNNNYNGHTIDTSRYQDLYEYNFTHLEQPLRKKRKF